MDTTPRKDRLSPGDVLFWALTWGVGAAGGVALGGWLTVVGGSGAPGSEGLDVVTDLVVLPVVALLLVTLGHLGVQIVSAAIRRRTVARGDR